MGNHAYGQKKNRRLQFHQIMIKINKSQNSITLVSSKK